jgi:uncharacterized protein Veg
MCGLYRPAAERAMNAAFSRRSGRQVTMKKEEGRKKKKTRHMKLLPFSFFFFLSV